MYFEKENQQEIFRCEQKERGIKNITQIGDSAPCPGCKRASRIVWISKDGKTAGIQCPASHSLTDSPDAKLRPFIHSSGKTSKHMVFITDIE